MTTRRRFLAAAPALFAVSLLHPARAANPDSAAAFVDQLLKDLLAIANGSQPVADKRTALAGVVEARVDLRASAWAGSGAPPRRSSRPTTPGCSIAC